MVDLRKYEEQIRELIDAENDFCDKFKWKILKVTKSEVFIWWDFLQYAYMDNRSFSLKMSNDSKAGDWLFSFNYENHVINCYMVTERWNRFMEGSIYTEMKNAVEKAVEDIFRSSKQILRRYKSMKEDNEYKGACQDCDFRHEDGHGFMVCGCKDSHMAQAPFLNLDDGCEYTTDEYYHGGDAE